VKPYYEDEWVTLYHGEALDVLRQLPAESVDVLMTDPPYSSGGMFRGDRQRDVKDKYTVPGGGGGSAAFRGVDYGTFAGDSRDQRSWMGWVAAWSFAALRATRVGGHAFIFTDWRQLPAATDAAQLGGWSWRGLVTWDKGQDRGLPVRGYFRSNVEYVVWATHGPTARRDEVTEFPGSLVSAPIRSGGTNRYHPTEKPVELLRHLLAVVPGAQHIILDPFAGSGSSLVAAKESGHRAIGVEIDERYCEIAARRLSQDVLDFGGVA
jgi:site-specific DNA-methyltransferase (adenine-specific)